MQLSSLSGTAFMKIRGLISTDTHLDPIVTQNYRDFEHQPLPEQHVAYAGAIIRSLQLSLRLEREAHAESRARIHLLEAHVALRDAELERYVQHIQELPIKTSRHKGKGKEAPEKELKLAEVSSMLQRTVANNKVLEIEVQNLVNKVNNCPYLVCHTLIKQPVARTCQSDSECGRSDSFSLPLPVKAGVTGPFTSFASRYSFHRN